MKEINVHISSIPALVKLLYTFEPIKIGQEIKIHFWYVWYISIWYIFALFDFHTHILYNLDMIFYHQLLFDT